MAKQRRLSRAPIAEALIDIHVAPRAELSIAGLADAIGRTPDFGYYVKGPISQGHFGFTLTPEGQRAETTARSQQIGLRLHSTDERWVAQCRLAGFTLSRLPPYEDWSRLIAEARRIWSIYVQKLAPLRVTTIATRFINNLQLPMQPGTSFQTYLHKLVEVPDDAPQAVASFFQRFQLVDLESRANVNLTLALDEAPASGPMPVILDVEAFTLANLAPDDDDLWRMLERLRDLKNRTFFSSITEQAAELYE